MRETKKGQFINLVKEERPSEEAYSEMYNLCLSRPDNISFRDWAHQTSWSRGAIIANFRYHCLQLNGQIDWEEFETLYSIFKSKIYSFLS